MDIEETYDTPEIILGLLIVLKKLGYSNRKTAEDEYSIKRTRFQGKIRIMIWVEISYDGQEQLYFISGNVTADSYLDILKDCLIDIPRLQNGELIFQQDNAASHQTRKVLDYLEEQNFDVLNWPPQSPDLNIIENIWSVMKKKIFERADEVDSIGQLEKIIEDIFFEDEHIFSVIRNCYQSLNKRIQSVINNKGGQSGY